MDKIKFLIYKSIKNIQTESYKSAVITILLAALLSASYSVINYLNEYKNIDKYAESKAKIITDLGKLAVQESLWDLDIATMEKIITSLFFDKEVTFTEIKSTSGETFFKKKVDDISSEHNYNSYLSAEIIKDDGITGSGFEINNQKLGTIIVGVTKYYKQVQLTKKLVYDVVFMSIILILVCISIIAILIQEKHNQERIKIILDNMADSVITTDINLIVKSCNLATEKMFGYPSRQIIGKKFEHLVLLDKSIYQTWDENTQSYYSASVVQNINGLKENGDFFPVEFNLGTITLNGEKLFIIVIRDITIRNEVNKMKDEFVSVVSHELRTPLTSIIASLKLVIANVLGEIPEKAKDMLEVALNSSNGLLRLINNILDIDKINNKKIVLSMEMIELNLLIKQLIEANTIYANQYKVKLVFEEPEELFEVNADKEKLSLVITNLLSNASKFSPENSEVKVLLNKTEKFVRISVVDKGPGISDEHKEFIFKKFTQIDSSMNRKKGGSGLGLYISKSFIEHMGGNLGIESKVNEGSTFYIDLPLPQY